MSAEEYPWGRMHRALQDVGVERYRQESLVGSKFVSSCATTGADAMHDADRLAVLAEEFGEAAREVVECDRAKLRTELVQVAAVAVAWIEALDAED